MKLTRQGHRKTCVDRTGDRDRGARPDSHGQLPAGYDPGADGIEADPSWTVKNATLGKAPTPDLVITRLHGTDHLAS